MQNCINYKAKSISRTRVNLIPETRAQLHNFAWRKNSASPNSPCAYHYSPPFVLDNTLNQNLDLILSQWWNNATSFYYNLKFFTSVLHQEAILWFVLATQNPDKTFYILCQKGYLADRSLLYLPNIKGLTLTGASLHWLRNHWWPSLRKQWKHQRGKKFTKRAIPLLKLQSASRQSELLYRDEEYATIFRLVIAVTMKTGGRAQKVQVTSGSLGRSCAKKNLSTKGYSRTMQGVLRMTGRLQSESLPITSTTNRQ